jgi:hypothetical protein
MDILKYYHQLLSSTAANGASFTVEIFMSCHQIPSRTIDLNFFIENMVGSTKENSDRKSNSWNCYGPFCPLTTSLVHLTRWCIPLPFTPTMQAGAYCSNAKLLRIMQFFPQDYGKY